MNGSVDGSARWKSVAAVILIILGCFILSVSAGIIWLNQIILDTDKYVETIQPLSEDPAVKDAVATQVTDELFKQINVQQLAQEVLPDKVDFLAAPIVGATQGFVEGEVRKGLDTPRFAELWTDINRKAHDAVNKMLLGEGDIIKTQNGQITLDLGVVFDDAKAKLDDRGINVFDNVSLDKVNTTYNIYESQKLASLQNRISQLNNLAVWLPIIAVLLLIAAIWLSSSRMVAVIWIGLGLSTGMVVLLVGLSYAHDYFINELTSSGTVDMPVATSYINLILDSLKTTLRRVFAFGLFIALIGFALSPYGLLVRVRTWFRKLYKVGIEKGKKVDLGPVGPWVSQFKAALQAGGVVLFLVVMVAMDQPTVSLFLVITALLLLYLGALEFLTRKAA